MEATVWAPYFFYLVWQNTVDALSIVGWSWIPAGFSALQGYQPAKLRRTMAGCMK